MICYLRVPPGRAVLDKFVFRSTKLLLNLQQFTASKWTASEVADNIPCLLDNLGQLRHRPIRQCSVDAQLQSMGDARSPLLYWKLRHGLLSICPTICHGVQFGHIQMPLVGQTRQFLRYIFRRVATWRWANGQTPAVHGEAVVQPMCCKAHV